MSPIAYFYLMKSTVLLMVLGICASFTAAAQKAQVSFGVAAVCGMCEARIEAAYDLKGIVAADFDLETKTLHVVYKSKKWDEERLHKVATAAGHDTDTFKATDEAYANMHGCCKYREGGAACSGHEKERP